MPMTASIPIAIAAALAAAVAAAAAALWAIAAFSGWRRIAAAFPDPAPTPLTQPAYAEDEPGLARGVTGFFGRWTRYARSLTVAADADGLRLRTSRLFRPFHPPLRIPWRAVARIGDPSFARGPLTVIVVRLSDRREQSIALFGARAREIVSAAAPSALWIDSPD